VIFQMPSFRATLIMMPRRIPAAFSWSNSIDG
jgi:hypothetical protein